MIHYKFIAGIAILASISTPVALAQSAHVHGEGRVNIAIEGDRLFLQLESPGADIVGFEHAAHSEQEKNAVAKALAQLGDPLQVMRFDPAAECEVQQASARIEGSEKHKGHEEHEGHEGHDDHKEHGGNETHGSFVAEYEFACDDIDALRFIEFLYFDLFANAQSLEIVLIDDSGQRRLEITRGSPELRLDQ
jgi:hypothetical protein